MSAITDSFFKTYKVNLIIFIILLSIITNLLEHFWLRNIVSDNSKVQQQENLVRIGSLIERRYQQLILQNNRELKSLVNFSRQYSGSTEQLNQMINLSNQALSGVGGDGRKTLTLTTPSAAQKGVIASLDRNGEISPYSYVATDLPSDSLDKFSLFFEGKVRENQVVQLKISEGEMLRALGVLSLSENFGVSISIHRQDEDIILNNDKRTKPDLNKKVDLYKKNVTHIDNSQEDELFLAKLWHQALINPLTKKRDFYLVIGQSQHESSNLQSSLIELLFFSLFVTILGASVIGYIYISRIVQPIKKLNHVGDITIDLTKKLSEERATEGSPKELKTTLTKHSEDRTFASLGRMLINLSHHLNTPLSINVVTSSNIRELSSSVRNKLQQGKMKRSELFSFLDNLEMNVAEQQIATDKVINHLEKIRRVTAITSTDILQPLDKVVSDTLIIYQNKLDDKKIKIHMESPAPDTKLDGHSIHRILCNLIENSLEHAFNGKESGRVFINIEEINGCISIYYHDDGVGLPESKLNSIFEPFSNCSKVGARLGLGIYEIYSIVSKKLNGHITAEAGPYNGLAFNIKFGVL